MGMFDRIWIPCPACGALVEVQSKGGRCLLDDYGHRSVPIQVAADAIGDTCSCEACGQTWAVDGPRTVDLALVRAEDAPRVERPPESDAAPVVLSDPPKFFDWTEEAKRVLPVLPLRRRK